MTFTPIIVNTELKIITEKKSKKQEGGSNNHKIKSDIQKIINILSFPISPGNYMSTIFLTVNQLNIIYNKAV
ncbi:unnamed protein product [Schistosoma bovis]|nr:unnamed protein product [Schistosoma bovis]